MKRIILLVALLALPIAIAACGNDDDGGNGNGVDDGTENGNGAGNGELRDVTMMLDWTPNTNHLGIYVAQAQGYYEEEGLNVSIVEPGASGAAVVVAEGSAHFGISVQEAVIPARSQDVPLVAIAAIVQHNTSSLMSLAGRGIERPADLAGHAYGGFGGPLETELIRTLVECDGGDPDAVTFTEVGDVDYLIGMDRGQYDFVWIFDGWDGIRAEQIEGEAVNFIRFIDYVECIPDWYTPVIITSEGLMDDDPELMRAFLAATTRGYEFAMENPGDAAQMLIDAVPELDAELVRLSADFLGERYVSDEGRRWGEQDLAIWERFEAFLREAGLTDTEIDVEAAYTNEFLP